MIVRGCTLKNYGDTLNRELVELISGEPVRLVNNKFKNDVGTTIYMCVGSVLGWADKDTIVWGTGKMSNTSSTMFKEKPKQICAVRGPLTRKEILKYGYECPEVYGDPALLMPRFYAPKVEKRYKLGIICHQIDKGLKGEIQRQIPQAYFIDVQDDVYKFIDNIKIRFL